MKTYIGTRLEEGCEVYVEEDGKRYPLALRLDIANKSPTGFDWGYNGSGPAQLALAILADYFGPKAPPDRCPCCDGQMKGWQCITEGCEYDGTNAGTPDKWSHIQGGIVHFKD